MKKRRAVKGLLLAAMVGCCACLTGCWDGMEINQIAIILGIGVDAGSAPGSYRITAQIARPSKIKTSNEQGIPEGQPYINVEKEGEGIHMAMAEMARQVSRRPYTAHNQCIVVGAEVAAEDIASILDTFIRNMEARLNVRILIAEGEASELLREEVDLEEIPAMHLRSLLRNQVESSAVMETTLLSFFSDLIQPGIAPTVPLVGLYEDESGAKRAKIRGMAMFDGGRMVGALDEEQTFAMLLVQDKVRAGSVNLAGFGGPVSLDITQSHTAVSMRMEEGRANAVIRIRQELTIAGAETERDIAAAEARAELERVAALEISRSVEEMIAHTKALGLDVCGFGDRLYRRYPRESGPLLERWAENYRDLQVEVDVSASIELTGAILRPFPQEGGGR